MNSQDHGASGVIRKLILAILVFGFIGAAVELLLLGHYEGLTQIIPLVLIGVGLIVVVWHVLSGRAEGVGVIRVVMAAVVVSGGLGVALHYWGSMEFQKEVDPSISGYALFMKVMHSKAPPVLAPGLMVQLGLLGLVYTYRHPRSPRL